MADHPLIQTLGKTWLDQNQDAKRRRESLKIVLRFFPGGSPGHPESGPAPSLSTLEQRKTRCDPTGAQKITKKSRKSAESRPKEAVLRPKLDPKIEPGTENVRSETAPEAIFGVFSCRCRSEWLSGPIFGGSDLSKLCSHHSGSTILRKSPFSEKHQKSGLRGLVLGPELAEN